MANSRGSESSNVSSFSILAFIPNNNCLGGCYPGDNPLAFNDQLTTLPSLGEHISIHKHTLHFEQIARDGDSLDEREGIQMNEMASGHDWNRK